MALKGNLQDFGVTQLLNLVNLAKKTGVLTIEGKEGSAKLFFKNGRLIYSSPVEEEANLATMLQKAGKISSQQARVIVERSGINSDKALGQELIRSGYLSKDDIIESVKVYMLDIVYDVFSWENGFFNFEQDQLPPPHRIVVPISLENVIIEGSRRIKENKQLDAELPDLNYALRFTDNPDARLRNVNLSVEEWRVISFINPRNTIKQIAQSTNMDDFQMRKIVHGMLLAGLVELVRPEGYKPPTAVAKPAPTRRQKAAAKQSPAVKRSMVEKLIDRIKKI